MDSWQLELVCDMINMVIICKSALVARPFALFGRQPPFSAALPHAPYYLLAAAMLSLSDTLRQSRMRSQSSPYTPY